MVAASIGSALVFIDVWTVLLPDRSGVEGARVVETSAVDVVDELRNTPHPRDANGRLLLINPLASMVLSDSWYWTPNFYSF